MNACTHDGNQATKFGRSVSLYTTSIANYEYDAGQLPAAKTSLKSPEGRETLLKTIKTDDLRASAADADSRRSHSSSTLQHHGSLALVLLHDGLVVVALPEACCQDLHARIMHLLPAVEAAPLAHGTNP
eukprot:CAMPEP_0203858882 /NCGR_PEP_ID=MMETSP0359-20131031/11525_1 /ASSEMBLY_ACC=CAM_ASM_000338 /TAXON_ID=268821 /ORGANISM="Scrippsiella Hangoei, Strain SHTV-5" /LENGTH=128 /DNA_ID=CAMNT_0050775711 /DNA_START=140 /DNA_END=522 /DNA_ORIENTATION=+